MATSNAVTKDNCDFGVCLVEKDDIKFMIIVDFKKGETTTLLFDELKSDTPGNLFFMCESVFEKTKAAYKSVKK